MSPNDADGMANSVDPDLGLHCLPRHICPKTSDHYSKLNILTGSDSIDILQTYFRSNLS